MFKYVEINMKKILKNKNMRVKKIIKVINNGVVINVKASNAVTINPPISAGGSPPAENVNA